MTAPAASQVEPLSQDTTRSTLSTDRSDSEPTGMTLRNGWLQGYSGSIVLRCCAVVTGVSNASPSEWVGWRWTLAVGALLPVATASCEATTPPSRPAEEHAEKVPAGGAEVGGADSAGTQSTAGGADRAIPQGPTPSISDLAIEPNPNLTISCYVSWTTDVPSTSEVQFGIDAYEYRIEHRAPVTEHRVLVIGMHAGTDYLLKAVSTTAGGSDEAEGTFSTGRLPSEVPLAERTVAELDSADTGWTLTNAQVGAGPQGFGGRTPAVIVIYDEEGIPVWYYIDGDSADTRGDLSTELLDNLNVLIGAGASEPPREVDLAGNVVWEGPEQPRPGAAGEPMSHHTGKLDNGNYVLLRDTISEVYGVGGQRIEEITPGCERVWEWDIFDHVVPAENVPSDWCHANSVTIDEESDVFYISCRFQGLFKAERYGAQEVIWQMGAAIDDPNAGDVTYLPPESMPSDIHDPEVDIDGGTILLYDNGGYATRTGDREADYHSRVLEYAIDEASKTATLVWEFPGDFEVDAWYRDEWYTPYWGDADRLANGNVLVTAGMRGEGTTTRIFEVTRAGRVVWEIQLESNNGSYRAQRLSPPPLVRRIR